MWKLRLGLPTLAVVVLAVVVARHTGIGGRGEVAATAAQVEAPWESGLPLPSSLPLVEFEIKLYPFLDAMLYDDQPLPGHLHWVRDKSVRDTGDYIDRIDYSTHRSVRVYYSPSILNWVKGGRVGAIPDGAMMVKEQYAAPAERYVGMSDAELRKLMTDVTVMIRDVKGSTDGWFWADYASGQQPDNHLPPFNFPNAGFGQYCLRCHASAEGSFTFAATRNIQGFPGNPLVYNVDDSWKAPNAVTRLVASDHGRARRAAEVSQKQIDIRLKEALNPGAGPNKAFVDFFNQIAPVPPKDVVAIPNISYDHSISGASRPQAFVTSDQCLMCHGGLGAPYGVMYPSPITGISSVPYGGTGINVSPFGEWRWSMMGLAGRDPIFFAQLESEMNLHPKHRQEIAETCLRCHAAMGERQQNLDHGDQSQFLREFLQITNEADPNFKYGALGREGIGCLVCHRMIDSKKPLDKIDTGRFDIGAVGELFGPFPDKEISTLPMKNALAMTPKGNAFVRSSQLCATCHVIDVPVFNKAGDKVGMFLEQTTYLEWLNSEFENETRPGNPKAQGCQQCHMPGNYHGQPVRQRIAAAEDDTYPKTDHRAANNLIQTTVQPNSGRHELLGINLFGMEMFRQFDGILGVNTAVDFMTGSTSDLARAIDNSARQATSASAKVSITSVTADPATVSENGKVRVDARVENLTGHRFPSGVGFRRAFLELRVIDNSQGAGRLAWASGRTNELGIIVDGDGKILPSEFFDPAPSIDPPQFYERHHAKIDSQDHVQIYQELVTDPEGQFTTSFAALNKVVKDNRLLPRGWTKEGPPGAHLSKRFLDATHPEGVAGDPTFVAGSDTLTYEVPLTDPKGRPLIASGNLADMQVVATLYYQSIPPFYLKMRFRDAKGDDTKRLYYVTSNLQLPGTRIDGWKLQVAQDSQVGTK